MLRPVPRRSDLQSMYGSLQETLIWSPRHDQNHTRCYITMTNQERMAPQKRFWLETYHSKELLAAGAVQTYPCA